MLPSPKELDAQSKIHIDKWLDVDSEEVKSMDDNYAFTKQCIRLGFVEPAFFAVDSLGRIWGRGEDNRYYPFHFNKGKELIGYRLSKKATN